MLTSRSLALLLPLLLLLLALQMLGAHSWASRLAVVAVVTAGMVSGLVVVSERRRTLWVGLGLLAPALAMGWWSHVSPTLYAFQLMRGFEAAFYLFLAIAIARFAVSRNEPASELLLGATCSYLLFGFAWSSAYTLLVTFDPHALTIGPAGPGVEHFRLLGPDITYFSFVTLTTSGFGDITALSGVARLSAVVEALVGQLYLVIVLSRLVK